MPLDAITQLLRSSAAQVKITVLRRRKLLADRQPPNIPENIIEVTIVRWFSHTEVS